MKVRRFAAGLAATALLGMSVAVAAPADAASLQGDPVVTPVSSSGGATTLGLDRLFCYWLPQYCNSHAYD
jgi:hypothetical protein